MSSLLTGKVQTVLGVIEPDALGVTLMHEHILTDLSVFFKDSDIATEREIAHQKVSLENLHWVRFHPINHVDNLRLTDENLMIKEVMRFKLAGGQSIVEMSNTGLYGDPIGVARIARATGLNIIKGAGFYIGKAQSAEVQGMSTEKLAEQIVAEIRVGIGGTGVRAGIIGEIGCNAPLEEFEKKSLRAAALAQQETGAMINVHPSHRDDLVLENARILKEAGADMSRVVLSHADFAGFSEKATDQLLDQGCTVEYDTFSFEGYYPPYWGHHISLPTDDQRIKAIVRIIKRGHIKQVVISTDICLKHLLASYGGGGYDHLIRNAVPLMRLNGMDESQIATIMVSNPKRLLTFV